MDKSVQVFFSVTFGFVAFLVAFTLGSAITLATGIPLAGGLLNGVLTGMVLAIGMIATRFFPSATIMWCVFAICATPTTTLGPPGVYKVVIGLVAGVIWDSIYKLTKYSRGGLYAGALLGSASIMLTLVGALRLGFGQDAAVALQKYSKALWFLLAINLVITWLGVFLGESVYNRRLIDLPLFKNLRKHAS